jgi:hypothetical protein
MEIRADFQVLSRVFPSIFGHSVDDRAHLRPRSRTTHRSCGTHDLVPRRGVNVSDETNRVGVRTRVHSGNNGGGSGFNGDVPAAAVSAVGASQNVPICPIGAEATTNVVAQAPAGLSVAQLRALELLLDGTSVGLVAKTCGVDRRTIYRWRNEDAAFRAELERGRREIWIDSIDRMRMLVSRSLDVLDEQLDDDYDPVRVRAAGMVLNHSGLRKLIQDGLVDGEQ